MLFVALVPIQFWMEMERALKIICFFQMRDLHRKSLYSEKM